MHSLLSVFESHILIYSSLKLALACLLCAMFLAFVPLK